MQLEDKEVSRCLERKNSKVLWWWCCRSLRLHTPNATSSDSSGVSQKALCACMKSVSEVNEACWRKVGLTVIIIPSQYTRHYRLMGSFSIAQLPRVAGWRFESQTAAESCWRMWKERSSPVCVGSPKPKMLNDQHECSSASCVWCELCKERRNYLCISSMKLNKRDTFPLVLLDDLNLLLDICCNDTMHAQWIFSAWIKCDFWNLRFLMTHWNQNWSQQTR